MREKPIFFRKLLWHSTQIPCKKMLISELIHSRKMINSLPRFQSREEFSCTHQLYPHKIIVCSVIRWNDIAILFGHVLHYLILTILEINDDRFILLLLLLPFQLHLVPSLGHLHQTLISFQLVDSAHHTFQLLRLFLGTFFFNFVNLWRISDVIPLVSIDHLTCY